MPPKSKLAQAGRGLSTAAKNFASKALAFAKQHQLASKGLAALDQPKAAAAASLLGYGRRRKRRVARR